MSTSDVESGTDLPNSSNSALPDQERHTERVVTRNGVREFLVVEHTANVRKNSKISAIWHHGGERRRLDDRSMERYWRCAYCKGSATILKVAGGNGGQTAYALAHLKNKHRVDCNADDKALPSSTANFQATASAGASAVATVASKAVREAYGLVTTFDAAKFRQALIMFIVMCNIAFSVVESQYFQALLNCCSTALTPLFIKAHNTVKRWILEEFEKKRLQVKAELATARSRIHISFDGWTSPNGLAIVGVVVHYLDKDLINRSYLVGMRRINGAHTGENIAEAVIPILVEMEILPKLGYFIADNDGRNDTCIRAILRKHRPDIKDPDSRRVRCLGHIINLAAKAFLFGKNADAFEDSTDTARKNGHLDALREEWRKQGPVEKLHNTIKFIRCTPQRREVFERLMKDELPRNIAALMVICDNDTRWNSTYLSMERALVLEAKIRVYSEDHKDELGEDFITLGDWDVIRELKQHLEPFWELTIDLQSQATDGTHGAIWEALPAIEYLLRHLEKLKESVPKQKRRIRECVMNSWSLLQKYYNLTDKNHGIYACATLLNPGLRKRHFIDNWTGDMADFIPIMEATCWDTYKVEYLPLANPKVPEPVRKFTFRYSIYGTNATDEEDDSLTSDEFQRFISATPTTVARNDTHWNPIKWWIDESKKGNFDTLHLYALDHLSCPAMATQCERVFSAARRTLTPERNALGMKVIEACECLRWWWRNGVVEGMPAVCPMTPRAAVEAQFVTALVGDSALSDASEEGVD